MGGCQGLVLVPVTVFAQQMGDEVGRADSDRPVDLPHRRVVPRLPERLPPGDDVEVVGVGEGAVDVE